VYSDVLVARVEENGSCAGLLKMGDRILYLNSTPIANTSDVHAFIRRTVPNQTIVIITDRGAVITKLGGGSTGKLGIGIVNIESVQLFKENMYLPDPELIIPENRASGNTDMGINIIGIILIIALLVWVSFNRLPLWRMVKFAHLARISNDPSRALYHCLILFISSFILRLVFTLAYFTRFGWHSTNVLELWFYADVASGSKYFLHPLDPTIYILRFFSFFSPEKTPFYSTIICAIVLSSIVPILVYYLVKDIHGSKAALISGLIYGFLVQPLALSTTSFTHHLTQIPISLLFLISVIRAIQNRGKPRLFYCLSLIPLGVLGYFINVEIFIYILMGYVLISISIIRWLLQEKGHDNQRVFAVLMLVLGLLMLPGHVYFDDVTSASVSMTSKDAPEGEELQLIHPPEVLFITAVPLPSVVYLRFYGIYALFIPFGIYLCWRRRDLIPYMFLLVGILVSLHWTRGSRILDLGVAMLAGIGLANIKREWNLVFVSTALVLSLIYIFFLPMSYLQSFFLLCLLAILLGIYFLNKEGLGRMALFSSLSFCVAVSAAGLLVLEMPQSTQAEYDSLIWLRENSQPGEKIITSLDRGHIPPALTNLDSVSNEFEYRPEIAKAFFQIEKLAAITLKEWNVTYVMVSSDDLQMSWNQFGMPMISSRGYITFKQEMRDVEIPFLLFFRLTYPDKLTYFQEIHNSTWDNTVVRIFRIREEVLGEIERPNMSNRVTVSTIVRNLNDVNIRLHLPIFITDEGGFLRGVDSMNLDLGPRETLTFAKDYIMKAIEGLKVSLNVDDADIRSRDELEISGTLETKSGGTYLFRYRFSDGSTEDYIEYLPEGKTIFRHLIRNGAAWPLLDFEITPMEINAGSEPTIAIPPQEIIPPAVIFSNID